MNCDWNCSIRIDFHRFCLSMEIITFDDCIIYFRCCFWGVEENNDCEKKKVPTSKTNELYFERVCVCVWCLWLLMIVVRHSIVPNVNILKTENSVYSEQLIHSNWLNSPWQIIKLRNIDTSNTINIRGKYKASIENERARLYHTLNYSLEYQFPFEQLSFGEMCWLWTWFHPNGNRPLWWCYSYVTHLAAGSTRLHRKTFWET